jgi:hypothetical protein
MCGPAAPVPDNKNGIIEQGLTVNHSFIPQSLVRPERYTYNANAQDGEDAEKIFHRNTIPEYQHHQMQKRKPNYGR